MLMNYIIQKPSHSFLSLPTRRCPRVQGLRALKKAPSFVTYCQRCLVIVPQLSPFLFLLPFLPQHHLIIIWKFFLFVSNRYSEYGLMKT